MIINKAYIKITNKKDRNILSQIIDESIKNSEISWNDDIATLIANDCETFQLKLVKILSLFFQDFYGEISILIVPFFDDIFLKYLTKINNEVCTAFDIFLRNVNDITTKKDAKTIINKIDQKDLDTLKAFLMCNGNSTFTANELYIHRNTFNYRVNNLAATTNIDIRDLNSMMFINLLFNICASRTTQIL